MDTLYALSVFAFVITVFWLAAFPTLAITNKIDRTIAKSGRLSKFLVILTIGAVVLLEGANRLQLLY